MSIDRSVGFADQAELEVVGPPDDQSVEVCHYRRRVQLGLTALGRLANRPAVGGAV